MTDFTATVSLQSLNYPTRYVRHQNFVGLLTDVSTELDSQDATFYVGEPSAEVRLQAAYTRGKVSRDSYFLRHFNFAIRLEQEDLAGSVPELTDAEKQFRADTTFHLVLGLADPSCVSLQSANYSDRFLRHRDFALYVEPVANSTDRKDATFRLVPGLAPVPAPVLR